LKLFKYTNHHLNYTIILFNKFFIYYVKKAGVKYWYKDAVPFIRLHCSKF
jgi:hypothetical protein